MTTDKSGLAGSGARRDPDIDWQKRTTTAAPTPPAVDRLLVFAPNWLGDAVMALPALTEIREALPAACLEVAARPSVAPLFTLVPGLDRVVTLDQHSVGRVTRNQPYDAALLLTNSFNSARLARGAGISERWGYRADFRSPLLTRAIAQPPRVHQSDFYRHLVHQLGFVGTKRDPAITVPDSRRAAARMLLAGQSWDLRSPLVAVAPGAAFGGAKRWPTESFAAVVQHLAAEGVRVVLIGTAGDRAAVEVINGLRHRATAIDLVGRTDLAMLAGVLTQCRVLVTNDSGTMHLAAALDIPVVAMFGPTRERETHPIGPRHATLTNPVWCRPCMLRECPLTHRCMTGISAARVLEATRSRL